MSTTNLYVVNGLPTYGNWGGPGWSAGEQVPAGTPLTDAQKEVIGKDDLDELFKALFALSEDGTAAERQAKQ